MKIRRYSLGVAFATSVCAAGASHAVGVDLDPAPPDLLTAVKPNIALTFDDSPSMSRAYMPDEVGDGSASNSNATGPGTRFSRQYYHYGDNTIYYNPSITYLPPLKPDGVSRFPDASYNAAWRDGICANVPADGSLGEPCTANIVNLSRAFYAKFDSFAGGLDYPQQSNQLAARDIPDSVRTAGRVVHDGGFYYERSANGTLTLVAMNAQGPDQKKNFANWYSYYRTRSLMARSSLATAFAGSGDAFRIAYQNLTRSPFGDDSTIEAFTGTARDAFFKWLLTDRVNGSGTPNRQAMGRAMTFFSSGFSNGRGTGANGRFNPYWENIPGQPNGGRELTCRQNFHLFVTDGYWNLGTPADASPRVSEAFALPDGRQYRPSSPHTRVYANETRPSDNAAAPSLADLGFRSWANDLRPDLANHVPQYLADSRTGVTDPGTRPVTRPFDDDEIYFNPANDPATWQHMVNYTVGLGIAGTLPSSTPEEMAGTIRSLRTGGLRWPVPQTNESDRRKLDDTWRAAVNSRGGFLSAGDPEALIHGIENLLRSATADRQGATTTASATSAILTAGNLAFGTSYSSTTWSGDLFARSMGADGKPSTANQWSAATQLAARAPATRVIVTHDGNAGKPFQYASLSAAQKNALDRTPASVTGDRTRRENPAYWSNDGLGNRRVDYLRGDRTAETAAPNFRARTGLLGAIIDSQPLYVSSAGGLRDAFPFGSPEHRAYAAGNSYENYVLAKRDRAPTLYVGSNDGMLHAFDAMNGAERWAYVPGTLIANGRMTRMTQPSGGLVPGADDSPISNDVFINGQWRTVLVGTLRLGGRGVYALDISDAAVGNETAVARKVLWEFNSSGAGGANLGYTYGSANIVRLNTGKWAVVVASGYFPVDGLDSDAPAAAANRTSLFVLDLETGNVIRELQTPANVTSYGLSRPGAYDADENLTTDVLMAGDLAGNLWRFDIGAADPGQWTVKHFFKTYAQDGDAGNLPITVMPLVMGDRIAQAPIWIFGTGKFIGEPDRETTGVATQSFFGVRDFTYSNGAASVTYPILPGSLVAQTLSAAGGNNGLRNLTAVDVPKASPGWRIALPLAAGERNTVTATALDASQLVVLTSLIPLSGGDPCSSARSGATMVVDASTGGVAFKDAEQMQPKVTIPGGDRMTVGRVVSNPPASGSATVGVGQGGGPLQVLIGDTPADTPPIRVDSPYWTRQSWRELFNVYESNP